MKDESVVDLDHPNRIWFQGLIFDGLLDCSSSESSLLTSNSLIFPLSSKLNIEELDVIDERFDESVDVDVNDVEWISSLVNVDFTVRSIGERIKSILFKY
ncbi:hypothetical protein BLOT_010510 [Blomia tropicalis]|nr:hypothetical protein BLOT_010510 [Blomia tropicalis]